MESMFRKIAVVSYETGGIPDINRDEENILLSKQGDLDSLLSNIQSLLDSSEKRIEMANRAYNYAVKRWSNVKAMHDIVNAYKNIIKDEINK
ncbi:MAG: glycosyltransferase [Bacteroidales bacterium]